MSDEDDDVCLKCHEVLSDDKPNITCPECQFTYHFGTCCGIAESTFKARNAKSQKAWRCETCSVTKRSQTAKAKKDAEIDVTSLLASMNLKLNSLLSMKETVSAIETSVQNMSDQYDELLKSVGQHDKDIKSLTKRVEKIENAGTEGQLAELKRELNRLEWHNRKQNLEIHGVPQTANENLLSLVNEVAAKLDVPTLVPCEIVSMHRLPTKPDKIPGIILHFAQQPTRDRWLDKRRNLKRPKDNEYILENMTRQDKALLWSTKQWAREHNFQYVWHRNGNIFVRRKTGDPAKTVKSEHDLSNMS